MDTEHRQPPIVEKLQHEIFQVENENENYALKETPNMSCRDTEKRLPPMAEKLHNYNLSAQTENDNRMLKRTPSESCLDTRKRLPPIVETLQKEISTNGNENEKRTLKGTLTHLGETSSLHGISKLASSRQVIVKVLWCILFLGTSVLFLTQIYELFKTFYSYPIKTTVKLDFNSIAFPAITICNMNPVKEMNLHLVPNINAVLQLKTSMPLSSRKKRESKMEQEVNERSKPFPASSPHVDDKVKALSRRKRTFKSKANYYGTNVENIQSQSLAQETVLRSSETSQNVEPLFESSFQSLYPTSSYPDSFNIWDTSYLDYTDPYDYLQWYYDNMYPSSSRDDYESTSPGATHSVINTQLIPSESKFISVSHISPSTSSPITDSTANSFSLSSDLLSSSQSLPQSSLPSQFLPQSSLPSQSLPQSSLPSQSLPQSSLPSQSLPQSSAYPGSMSSWSALYGNYMYDYFNDYDYYYDFYQSFYDEFNYHLCTDSHYLGSATFFHDQMNSQKDEWQERVEHFKVVFKNESVEKRKEIGHQKEDMIMAASFAGIVENTTNFHHFTSSLYGNCYTIASPKYLAWRSGSAHGINLILNLEIDEYVSSISTGYGIRMVFHEPGTYPLPSHEGITLSPATETHIGLRMMRISRLGEPHGDCDDGKEFFKLYHRRYSIASCQEFCRIQKVIHECDCIPVNAPDGINLTSKDLPVCDRRIQSVLGCILFVDIGFDSGDYTCNCKAPCRCSKDIRRAVLHVTKKVQHINETTFSKTLSTTYWPTDAYLAILLSVLCEDESFTKDFNYCDNLKSTPASELERFRYNFLQVKVYFEDLNYESITEEPMYERVRFLSDIGGAMGLFLGASVISFVEVVQLLLELFLLMKEKHLDKRKARVLPH